MTKNLFASETEIAALVTALRACALPRDAWTNGAHFAAALWLIARAPDMLPERDMPGLIRRYNESVGGVNSDSTGYHETITQASIAATRAFLADRDPAEPLHDTHRALMAGHLGKPDWPMAHWSKHVLMGTPARRAWVEPDIAPLPFPAPS